MTCSPIESYFNYKMSSHQRPPYLQVKLSFHTTSNLSLLQLTVDSKGGSQVVLRGLNFSVSLYYRTQQCSSHEPLLLPFGQQWL